MNVIGICNFIINDKFRVLHSPWGLKQGKTTIFGSQEVRDVLRQLAAIETPGKGLRILSNFRILVPYMGEEKNVTMSKNVKSPFKWS